MTDEINVKAIARMILAAKRLRTVFPRDSHRELAAMAAARDGGTDSKAHIALVAEIVFLEREGRTWSQIGSEIETDDEEVLAALRLLDEREEQINRSV